MPSIVQAINEFKFDMVPKDIMSFLKEREKIRTLRESGHPGPWTDDPILDKSKFLNVFREDDAVSRVINVVLTPLKSHPYNFYSAAYICRLVNHRDHIKWLFKDHDWLETDETLKTKMIEFTSRNDTVCNPSAYQINPRIGFRHGHRNIRDAMVHVIPARRTKVIDALASTCQINQATTSANDAFGGYTNFWMFQVAIDISYHNRYWMDPDSPPYLGSGSKNAQGNMEELKEYINTNKPDGWRKFHPYDVENALCEFRKYKMRQVKGIPNNRQFKRREY